MISNPNLILYACVCKESTILADFNSGDSDLETLAFKCIEKTPQLHSKYSHTVRNRTYSFLIDDRFVYFAIFDQKLEKSQGFWFLNCVKDAFGLIVDGKLRNRLENLRFRCFQEEMDPFFRRFMVLEPVIVCNDGGNSCLDAKKGKESASDSLIGKPRSALKKKKKRLLLGEINGESKEMIDGDSSSDGNLTREFSVSLHKNGLYLGNAGYQHAKRAWRRHVWVVLILDLVVCCVLFGIWLWVCRGFQCMDS